MATLFISDLHLCVERPRITELFLEFLANNAAHADALYILGDLFEAWVGDDAIEDPENARIVGAIRRLTTAGVPVYFVHGNRDFLVGEAFAGATGCTLLPEESRIRLYQEDVLIMHGDSLCTRDSTHQAWRAQVLDPAWQQKFLSQNIAARMAIATDLRQQSDRMKRDKSMEIMDVEPATVTHVMQRHQVRTLIHGHTHRPGQHEFDIDGHTARRIVLGDWYEQGSVLTCTADSRRLETLAL